MLTATLSFIKGAWGGAVVKALHYQSEGSIPGHWGFFPGHQTDQDIPGSKDGWCIRVMTLPPSCAECLEILEP